MPRGEWLERLADRIQMRPHLLQQALSLRCQLHPACLTQQQRVAQALLQLAHLVAERADRQVHRFGCTGQVAQAGRDHEIVQRLQGHPGH